MQSVDLGEMKGLKKFFDDVLKEFPEEKRKLHQRVAVIAEQIVKGQTGSETLSNMQESFVGSRGGYAAVKAKRGGRGPKSAGAITNYNENGHKIRKPSGRSKNYRPRIHTIFVNGRHFYQKSRSIVESAAIREAQIFAEEFAEKAGAGK